MVIKLYVSGISGNKEVKKKQQRVQMILDSKQIEYETIDITEPGKEKDKEFMQQNGKVRENLGKYPLPPQIFNDEDFCGDYEDFDMANEVDELEKFLHIECSKIVDNETKHNDESRYFDEDQKIANEKSSNSTYNCYDYHTYKVKWDGVNGLQEQIIDSTTGENDQALEVKESEVNGVVEDITPSKEIESDSDPKSIEDIVKEEENVVKLDKIEIELSNQRTEINNEDELPQREEKEEKNLESDNLSENGNKHENGIIENEENKEKSLESISKDDNEEEREKNLESAHKSENKEGNEQREKEKKNFDDIEEEKPLKNASEGENEEEIKNVEASQKELENKENENEKQNVVNTKENEEEEKERIEENESVKKENQVENNDDSEKNYTENEELKSDESEVQAVEAF